MVIGRGAHGTPLSSSSSFVFFFLFLPGKTTIHVKQAGPGGGVFPGLAGLAMASAWLPCRLE